MEIKIKNASCKEEEDNEEGWYLRIAAKESTKGQGQV